MRRVTLKLTCDGWQALIPHHMDLSVGLPHGHDGWLPLGKVASVRESE